MPTPRFLFLFPDRFSFTSRRRAWFALGMSGALSVLAFSGRAEIATHDSLPPPAQEQPALLASYADPRFQSRITRLTSARGGTAGGIVPDYAKRQAWNADESLLLLRATHGGLRLVDAKTFRVIKSIDDIAGDDVFWHPRNPSLLHYNSGNALLSRDVATDETRTLHTFAGFDFADTRGEGNLSLDGRFYAIAARTYNERTGVVTYRELQLLDLDKNEIVGRHALPAGLENFDWISISPSGKFIVVDYADTVVGRHHGVEVYDTSFNLIWQKPLGAGHSDLGVDADGADVLVMDIYDENSNRTIFKKFDLATGREMTLLAISPLFDQHISCRNTALRGWAVISTFDFVERLTATEADWLPFENEIFFLKLDGSGDVRRVAHHRSRRYSPETPDSDRSEYFAEPHATVNRKGDQILFGSNWSRLVARPDSLDTYLIQLDPGRLANLSIRSTAGTGADTLIVGFNLAGNGPTSLLIRGVGPGLGAFGVTGTVGDPALRLVAASGITVAQNDDWEATAATAAVTMGAFPLAGGSKDAALTPNLAPGAYTAQVGGGTGTALLEIYASGINRNAGLSNLSARTRVVAGGDALIAGFVITGSAAKTLLIRGIGPGLAQFGVTEAMPDPRLQLYRGPVLTGENRGWSDAAAPDANQAMAGAFSRAGAFALPTGSRDAALLVTLEAGAYTAQVSGSGNSAGIALVEIYEL